MNAEPGTVHVTTAATRTVIALEGEHDLTTRDAVRRAIASAAPELPLVVDMCATTFVDAAVVRAALEAGERHPRVEIVVAPGTTAERVVRILRPQEAGDGQRVVPIAGGPSPSTKISTITSDSGST